MIDEIQFTEEAWRDFEWFLERDKRIIKRIRDLLKDIARHPNEGIGKPERLRFQLSGYWSRRITKEHRLVYKVDEEVIIVISCRYHYE